ncbi:MAG: hypothetical protein GEU74_09215 [Nitriliruptorales bacterium]|nr:hypothetical protein [Nitriliruptorales bacterium]
MPPGSERDWVVPPLFAYGLLRPGERYWPQLQSAVRSHRPACVRGALYLHASGSYPMLDCTGDGWVQGDLFEVEDMDAVHALVFMELTAGYDARWMDVFPPGAGDPSGSAVAFCWPWGTTHRGARIASGDWQDR